MPVSSLRAREFGMNLSNGSVLTRSSSELGWPPPEVDISYRKLFEAVLTLKIGDVGEKYLNV